VSLAPSSSAPLIWWDRASTRWLAFALILFCVLLLRASVLGVGAPYITIDDDTAFEGGFLVWFGHAPPQRMYLESWLYGLSAVCVYAYRLLSGVATGGFDVDLITHAYRDFYGNPQPYVLAFRAFTLLLDLATVCFCYGIARRVLAERWGGWAAVCVAAMYGFSYNTIWSGIVARPDSVLAFLSAGGVYLYLRSDSGRDLRWLLAAAVLLGMAAGQKLHGALMTVLLCADIVRVQGLRAGWRAATVLACVSLFLFCVAAGSVLFDPLLYAKLRMANYKDDFSPWIHAGDQVGTTLRGMGWVTAPLLLYGVYCAFARREAPPALRTLAVLSIGWLLLFLSIRQLRAYWMLPILPVFYATAVFGITQLPWRALRAAAVVAVLAVLTLQSGAQIRALRSAEYRGLRDWVVTHARDRPFYILGFDALTLPKNTQCMAHTARIVQRILDADRAAGLSFTTRHAKNWEERTILTLQDMLGGQYEPGFEFYDYFNTPPELFAQEVSLDKLAYLVVEDRFDLARAPAMRAVLESQFRAVADVTGAGGGESGLKYRIYARR
jgi:hypothetical protein